ncbi:L,D-transpeptidase catalytic domain [Thiothrix caldifontis]|uniref:L,D-transpeptidase catalytic domain n=1 Tax=Thiothrix caldifontis TaxID=525918 RepID=A0A1H4BLJ6_9GAMM|nr:L,D-transpeptidase family protein [Thiothrix caldifontis]SEA48976.1 L,D-transpeptidase catalytic domain [Thiothrix caldifontis]
MLKKALFTLLSLALIGAGLALFFPDKTATVMDYLKLKTSGKYSVAQRLEQFGTAATNRLAPHFQQAGVAFPPTAITLLAFKDSKRLELYARDPQGAWQQVQTYPIQAASGVLGPKLREGDRQVPEGIYAIESLNPNSLFHVSLRLNYPNAVDREWGLADGREKLGSDIMIHGKAKSIGCLAMGDVVAEELFALVAWVGKENVRVMIAPTDFRLAASANVPTANLPSWTEGLYQNLRTELAQYPLGK